MEWFAKARTGPRAMVKQGVSQPSQKRCAPEPTQESSLSLRSSAIVTVLR
jgi:hypothetical protein